MPTNEQFDIRGIHYLALVCSDMKRTVDFYSGILGMRRTRRQRGADARRSLTRDRR